jgi:hypothetical protein
MSLYDIEYSYDMSRDLRQGAVRLIANQLYIINELRHDIEAYAKITLHRILADDILHDLEEIPAPPPLTTTTTTPMTTSTTTSQGSGNGVRPSSSSTTRYLISMIIFTSKFAVVTTMFGIFLLSPII